MQNKKNTLADLSAEELIKIIMQLNQLLEKSKKMFKSVRKINNEYYKIINSAIKLTKWGTKQVIIEADWNSLEKAFAEFETNSKQDNFSERLCPICKSSKIMIVDGEEYMCKNMCHANKDLQN